MCSTAQWTSVQAGWGSGRTQLVAGDHLPCNKTTTTTTASLCANACVPYSGSVCSKASFVPSNWWAAQNTTAKHSNGKLQCMSADTQQGGEDALYSNTVEHSEYRP